MKEIPVERDSRVDTGNISNTCTALCTYKWGNIARFVISVKEGGRGEKVKGEKNFVCTCVSIYCHCCNKIHI